MSKKYLEGLFATRLNAPEVSADVSQQDYFALDQAEYSTGVRHAAVIKCCPELRGSILDLGCGTGLILDGIREAGIRPAFYTGVDGMQARSLAVHVRLDNHHVNGEFHLKPMAVPFWEFTPDAKHDIALLIGCAGYWGLHELNHIRRVHGWMVEWATHGCISFPMIWDEMTSMGSHYIRRWAVDDITDCLAGSPFEVEKLEREFLVHW